MHWQALITTTAAVTSAVVAVVAVLHAARSFARSAELEAFLQLTERYEKITSELPDHVRTGQRWDSSVDPHHVTRLKYFNLCAEEYYLRKQGLLSDAVWSIWQSEMRATLASRPYVDSWPVLSRQFESYPEFAAFVEDAIDEGARPATGPGQEIAS